MFPLLRFPEELANISTGCLSHLLRDDSSPATVNLAVEEILCKDLLSYRPSYV